MPAPAVFSPLRETVRPPLFADFAPPPAPRSDLRQAITAMTRAPEAACVAALLPQARLSPGQCARVGAHARALVTRLRQKPRGSMVEELVREYDLSSREGIALMCLAESLLRIPDAATRDALIRDKIGSGDWRAHVGGGQSLFMNAASWGLLVTGHLALADDAHSLSGALTRLVARCGAPVIRRAVDAAICIMGEQFVMGRSIEEALGRARGREGEGFLYSFDMLGEAAMTGADATRYFEAYRHAITAIGAASGGRGIVRGPGLSVKLSALHPRYARAKAERVMGELLPRLLALVVEARRWNIGLTIDAEEQDRLELSLDLLEALCAAPELAGWDGIGFVVQAYGRRCPAVLDFVIDLARRTGRRIAVRLVKGAYWDAEIKRAQVDGAPDFPVFTRKVHTDLSYIACAHKLLAAKHAVFPQFATHNAQTLAAIHDLAGPDFRIGDYEFQCLHGMGEPLYEEIVGPLGRPCRIYAPVGTHETLLAYLVRRLLENGANSSFVNRIRDPAVPVEELIPDPAEVVASMPVPGAPHPGIAAPRALYGERVNSAALDLADDGTLGALSSRLAAQAATWTVASPASGGAAPRPVRNPGDHRDIVGEVRDATVPDVSRAVARAASAATDWAALAPAERGALLRRAADCMETAMMCLMGLIMREAGKSAANAVAEVREAVDFLRYYAGEAEARLTPAHRLLGPIASISPWNFPLAIFTGQVAAALAAGNPVLAKPAEETPLVAAEAVRILHSAGIPADVLQLLPGDGRIGAALVSAPQVAGVMFTGSTEVAQLIARSLAGRPGPDGRPVPLIAETGGQNAMIVDSSALPEQVVADVLASAFDSAGQRCSALRVLCLQDEVADTLLAMLKGAMAELEIGRTDRLSVDVGPVIHAEARRGIEAHVSAMAAKGCPVHRPALPPETAQGTFVAPTLIEISSLADLGREVFGPVLHVLRWRRRDLGRLVSAINATGYGLTFGLHTRLDSTVAAVTERIEAGNLYVNRNIIGAVVGVQPFGGRGLSGTGPKAGGPLYLSRLLRGPQFTLGAGQPDPAALAFVGWLEGAGRTADAEAMRAIIARSPLGMSLELPGPVGERNIYELRSRGTLLLMPETETGLIRQFGTALATGNRAMLDAPAALAGVLATVPEPVAARLAPEGEAVAVALVEGEGERLRSAARAIAERDGPIVPLHTASVEEIASSPFAYPASLLLEERSVSVNTAAAGGNASLLALA